MQKLSYSFFLLLIVMTQSAFAQLTDKNDADVINRFAPSDLRSIQDAKAKGDQAMEVSEFMNLANRIDGQISGPTAAILTIPQKNDLHFLYGAIWDIGIKMYGTLSDNQEKDKLLSYWNDSLQKKSAPIQIATLGETMDRNFLTPKVWSLLHETNDPSILTAFAYLVWKQGNEDDVKRLKEKRALLISDEYKAILQNGIFYRDYRIKGVPFSEIASPNPPSPYEFPK